MLSLSEMGNSARVASRVMGSAATGVKNRVLCDLASLLEKSRPAIKRANQTDIDAAIASGMSAALIDRLTLNDVRLDGLSRDLRALAELPDPVGERYDETVLPNGMKLCRQRVPLGVIGVIYESRPNVTIDVAGLAIKTGNAAILRGGKETIHSNLALVALVREALKANSLPDEVVQFIDTPDIHTVIQSE